MILIIMFAEPCLAQTEQTQWNRYRTNNDQFSVSLPTMPAMTTEMNWNRDLHKWSQSRVIAAYAAGVVYVIYILENDQKQTLESFVTATRSSRSDNWDVNSLQELNSDNGSGRQYLLTRLTVAGVVRLFATPERLYRFEAFGASADDQRITRFLSSISFSRNPEGADIIDGPGVPWRSPATEANLNPELSKIFSGKEVDRRPKIISKLEPRYTELARKNKVQGVVVLKAVFSRDGNIDDITIVSGQPDGLTENAVVATKQIKFIPAVKNGQFVSIWMQVEYNFGLY